MVEFIVIAIFVLVPLYLAVQALGKLGDVRHATVTGARYAAWERTVWTEDTSTDFYKYNKPNQKSAAQIHNEMLVRVLNDRRASFKYSNTDKGATTFANGIDPMWEDSAAKPLLDDPANVTLAAKSVAPTTDLMGTAIGFISKIKVPGMSLSLVPPVPTDTLAVATVNLNKVGAKSEVYQRLWNKSSGLPDDWKGLDYTVTGAVLSNTWAANAHDGTTEMVKASVPTAGGLGKLLSGAGILILGAWDASLAPRLDLGKVEVDVTPPDRLK
jgi:hypothetical protein